MNNAKRGSPEYWDLQPLGLEYDEDIAAETGYAVVSVRRERCRRDIRPKRRDLSRPRRRDIDWNRIDLDRPNAALTAETGYGKTTLTKRRLERLEQEERGERRIDNARRRRAAVDDIGLIIAAEDAEGDPLFDKTLRKMLGVVAGAIKEDK